MPERTSIPRIRTRYICRDAFAVVRRRLGGVPAKVSLQRCLSLPMVGHRTGLCLDPIVAVSTGKGS